MFALVTQLSITFSLPLTTDYVIARKLTPTAIRISKKFHTCSYSPCIDDLSVKNGKAARKCVC